MNADVRAAGGEAIATRENKKVLRLYPGKIICAGNQPAGLGSRVGPNRRLFISPKCFVSSAKSMKVRSAICSLLS